MRIHRLRLSGPQKSSVQEELDLDMATNFSVHVPIARQDGGWHGVAADGAEARHGSATFAQQSPILSSEALTQFALLARGKHVALLLAKPKTGRRGRFVVLSRTFIAEIMSDLLEGRIKSESMCLDAGNCRKMLN